MIFTSNVAANGGTASQVTNNVPLPNPLPKSGLYAVASAIDPTNTAVKAPAPLLEIGVSTQTLAFGQEQRPERST